jgi:AbrB family looped-hinge helix DNA binding protein
MPIEFRVKVQKVGGSLQITIPKPICESLRISKGDNLSLTVSDSEISVRKAQ